MNLYDKIDTKDFKSLLTDDESFMSYCPNCARETTFKRSKWYSLRRNNIELKKKAYIPGVGHIANLDSSEGMLKEMFGYDEMPSGKAHNGTFARDNNGTLFVKEYKCCIDSNHRKYEIFYRDIENDEIIKIGQYPSAYDIGIQEYLAKLKYVCSNKEAKEIVEFINKALTMESFGYGISALLYMRRTFERLIAISEDKNKLKNTGMKMAERIKNNPSLPEEFKENKRIYNIISQGIHNETEEECMELFNIIKVGFTILLRKTYEHMQEQKEMKELKKLVSSK